MRTTAVCAESSASSTLPFRMRTLRAVNPHACAGMGPRTGGGDSPGEYVNGMCEQVSRVARTALVGVTAAVMAVPAGNVTEGESGTCQGELRLAADLAGQGRPC
ncbi:hypothetical protein GCM10023083_11330 [Streptomyces phyllanthi]